MWLLKVAGCAFSGYGNGSDCQPVGWSVGPPLWSAAKYLDNYWIH